jgi:hypothetical protein
VVFPAPAGACSGCTSHGEAAILPIARDCSGDSCGVPCADVQDCAVVASVDQIQQGDFFGEDAIEGETLVALALMRLPWRGEAHRDLVDRGLDLGARAHVAIDGQLGAEQLHQIGAGERRLINLGCHRRQPTAVKRRHRRGQSCPRRGLVRGGIDRQSPCVVGPHEAQLGPWQLFGFGRAGGLLRGGQLRLGGLCAIDQHEIVSRPFPQLRGAARPCRDRRRGDAGHLRLAGGRINRCPLHANRAVELAAQCGLINHPGGARLVIERRAINRHQPAVGARLAVGDDHVSVQVWISGTRCLVLVGDRYQTRQPHQILLSRLRVVYAGVAGVLRQVLHRFGERGGVRVDDRFLDHVVAAHRADQRHTFRCAKRQVEAVHRASAEGAPACRVGRGSVVEPARHRVGIGRAAGALLNA